MKNRMLIVLAVFVVATGLWAQQKQSVWENNWPQWRGPFNNGFSANGNPPGEWGEDKNIKWKIEIPGKGHATPIVWGEALYVLSAVATETPAKIDTTPISEGQRRMSANKTDKVHRFIVYAINRQTGEIVWQKTVHEEHPEERTHELGSWASNSPVTDGQGLYAYFGSRGLYGLDLKGNVKWQRDFGQMETVMSFGEGSSPLLYKNKIYVVWDHEGESFIYALDTSTGADVWKIARDEGTSWASPIVAEVNGAAQIITAATNRIRSYDSESGALIWECSGLTRNVIPMAIYADGIVYITSGFRGSALFAIDVARAKGDITDSEAIVWKYNQDTPYTPSPVLVDHLYYMLSGNNGILTCLDARNGSVLYSKQKLEGLGNVYASLSATRDRIFVTGQKGVFYVLKTGPVFEVLAQNKLEDEFEASPVIVGDQLYLRGYKNLYCISAK